MINTIIDRNLLEIQNSEDDYTVVCFEPKELIIEERNILKPGVVVARETAERDEYFWVTDLVETTLTVVSVEKQRLQHNNDAVVISLVDNKTGDVLIDENISCLWLNTEKTFGILFRPPFVTHLYNEYYSCSGHRDSFRKKWTNVGFNINKQRRSKQVFAHFLDAIIDINLTTGIQYNSKKLEWKADNSGQEYSIGNGGDAQVMFSEGVFVDLRNNENG